MERGSAGRSSLKGREAWKEEALDDLPRKDEKRGKRKRLTIFLERTRDGHRRSDEHWNCFKGNVGKLLRDGVERMIIGVFERIGTMLN